MSIIVYHNVVKITAMYLEFKSIDYMCYIFGMELKTSMLLISNNRCSHTLGIILIVVYQTTKIVCNIAVIALVIIHHSFNGKVKHTGK